MQDVPPGPDFNEADCIGLVRDQTQGVFGGFDAEGGGVAVELEGFVGLVRDLAVQAAEAWAVRHHLAAVVRKPQAKPMLVEFSIALVALEVQRGVQIAVPGFERVIAALDDGLNVGPGAFDSRGVVKLVEDILGESHELDEVQEVEGGVGLDVARPEEVVLAGGGGG